MNTWAGTLTKSLYGSIGRDLQRIKLYPERISNSPGTIDVLPRESAKADCSGAWLINPSVAKPFAADGARYRF